MRNRFDSGLRYLLFAGLLLLPAGSTFAMLHVGSGQTYTTIEAAVAALADGDTIYIHNGTYNTASDYSTTIDSKKRIWIIGESMSGVVLDCSNTSYAFYITGSGGIHSDSIFFRNFTIKNSRSTVAAIRGGGSQYDNHCINFSNMVFDHCVNTAGQGGAINGTYLLNTMYIDTC